jgi:two-component system cell cycle response regulator
MKAAPEAVTAGGAGGRPARVVDTVAELSVSTPYVQARLAAWLEAVEIVSMDEFWTIVESAEHAERLAIELDRPDLQMRARLVRAEALLLQGDTTAAGRIAHETNTWAAEHGHPYLLARSHLMLSSFRRHIGDQSDALAHAVQCLAHTGDDVASVVRARHLTQLAVTLCESGSMIDTARRYGEALNIAVALGDLRLSLRLLNNLAYTAVKNHDGAEAWKLVGEMRAFASRHGVPMGPPYLDTIARIELMHGRYAAAEATLRPVVDEPAGRSAVDGHTLAECLLTVAEARRLRGDLVAAQASLDRAVRVCAEHEIASARVRVREEQAQLYAAAGRYREAYDEYRLFHTETQALQSAQREAGARTLQAVFETEEARRESARFREMAQRDPLTGLYNRRFVDEQLALLLAQAAERGAPLSVALIDLDHFKRVNDTLSHAIGDAVLQQVAVLLAADTANAAAEPAVAARRGGEEFLLILPDTGADEAIRHCDQLRQAIATHPWRPVTGELAVTVSIGVSTADAGDVTPSALLAHADRNLYAAKRMGRNRVVRDPTDVR